MATAKKKAAVKKAAAAKKTPAPAKKTPAPAPAARTVRHPAATAAPKPKAGTLCEILCTAAGVSLVAGETYPAFAERVCGVLSDATKFPEDVFLKLPETVRNFYDACIDPINTKQFDKLPVLSGFPLVTGETGAPVVAVGAPAAGKTATLPGVPKGGQARVDSVAYKVRRAVILHGVNITFEQACKDAKVTGEERGGNGWNAFFNTKQALKIAEAEGLYKSPKGDK